MTDAVPSISYYWHAIDDLPQRLEDLASPELAALASVWSEQRSLLQHTEGLRVFTERLQREWSIETGVIERVYSLDRGITQTLIEQGIQASLIPHSATDKDPEYVAEVIRDHQEVVEALFEFVKGERQLSTSYIKELHSALLRNQHTTSARTPTGTLIEAELLRGDWKKLPNNPERSDGTLHEYCPPVQVSSEMDQLVCLHLGHERTGVSPEVEAAWLHHRFTQIHPFQDGNGRVARALASLVFIRAGWFPLVVTREDNEAYIAALEQADDGNLQALIELFVRLQRRAFVSALGIVREVQQNRYTNEVILAARQQLIQRQERLRKEWEQARGTASSLFGDAASRLSAIRDELIAEITSVDPVFSFYVDREADGGARSHYFRHQIVTTAQALSYFANMSLFHAWARLVVEGPDHAEILFSIHGIGHEYRGVLAASVCFFRREVVGFNEREITDVQPCSPEVFQINYLEAVDAVRQRFEWWLNQSLVTGLEIWRRGL